MIIFTSSDAFLYHAIATVLYLQIINFYRRLTYSANSSNVFSQQSKNPENVSTKELHVAKNAGKSTT